MPRYIDAELALELHDGELWAWDVPDLKEFLAEVPTADVVPKGEVDAQLDDLKICLEAECKVCGEKTSKVIADLQEKLSNTKTDVAREIFEEIDVLIDDWKHNCIQSIQFIAELAELKKKYTEEER